MSTTTPLLSLVKPDTTDAADITVINSDLDILDNAVTLAGAQTLTNKTLSGTTALALGAVLNWNSGDVTLTHSNNSLQIAGASLGVSIDGRVSVAGSAGILDVGAPGSVTGAAAGDIVLANAKALRAANAGGTAAVALIGLDASNRVVLAAAGGAILWGTAGVGNGGGAAPTFGTIGGSGPTGAGQIGWLPFVGANGVQYFLPYWG